MIDFSIAETSTPGIYSLRHIEGLLHVGWAFTARQVIPAEEIAQTLLPQPDRHLLWILEPSKIKKRRNVLLTPTGGVGFFSVLPATLPHKGRGLQFFLGKLQTPRPDNGFVLVLKNRLGLCRFSTVKTAIAPGTVIHPGLTDEVVVIDCLRAETPNLAKALTWEFTQRGKLRGAGGWFRLSPVNLREMTEIAASAIVEYRVWQQPAFINEVA